MKQAARQSRNTLDCRFLPTHFYEEWHGPMLCFLLHRRNITRRHGKKYYQVLDKRLNKTKSFISNTGSTEDDMAPSTATESAKCHVCLSLAYAESYALINCWHGS